MLHSQRVAACTPRSQQQHVTPSGLYKCRRCELYAYTLQSSLQAHTQSNGQCQSSSRGSVGGISSHNIQLIEPFYMNGVPSYCIHWRSRGQVRATKQGEDGWREDMEMETGMDMIGCKGSGLEARWMQQNENNTTASRGKCFTSFATH